MKKKLYIHIGMPKTGSSALQAFLALNSKYLEKNGFIFPWHPGYGQLFQTSKGNAAKLHDYIMADEREVFLKKLNELNISNVLLSSETLFHTVRIAPTKFVSFFEKYDYQIICYVRKIDDLMESCINQLVKNHGLVDYSDVDSLVCEHDYSSMLVSLGRLIDKRKITIRLYDEDSFMGGTIFSDFLNVIGLDINESPVVYPEKNVNPSLNRDAFEFRRILNLVNFNGGDNSRMFKLNGLLALYSVQEGKDKSRILDLNKKKYLIESYQERARDLNNFFFNIDSDLFVEKNKDFIKYDGLKTDVLSKILRFIYEKDSDVFFTVINSFLIAIKDEGTNFVINSLSNVFVEIINEDNKVDKRIYQHLTSIFKPETNIIKSNFQNLLFSYSPDIKIVRPSFSGFEMVSIGNDPYFYISPIVTKKISQFYIVISVNAPRETVLQLHYQTIDEPSFGNKKFISRKLNKGMNEIAILLNNNRFNGYLRLDAGRHKGVYEFQHILVFSERKGENNVFFFKDSY